MKRASPSAPPPDPVPLPATAVPLRPLDELQVPPAFDGRDGINRADVARLQITATTDADAIACFLTEYDRSPGTYRIYQRECERLLLWAIVEVGKPLSSLNRQDFEGYLNFLADPQPAVLWCGPKVARASEKWRPFVGPLSESAVLTAVAAINSLMSYLVDAGYLAGNPLGLIRQRRRKMAAEAGGPLGEGAPVQPGLPVFGFDRSAAQPELQAAAGDLVQGGGHLGQQDGMAKLVAQHHVSDPEAFGVREQRGGQRPGLQGRHVRQARAVEMVVEPQ